MRIDIMLNVLVQYCECLIYVLKTLGKRGADKFVFEALKGQWLNTEGFLNISSVSCVLLDFRIFLN